MPENAKIHLKKYGILRSRSVAVIMQDLQDDLGAAHKPESQGYLAFWVQIPAGALSNRSVMVIIQDSQS